MEELRCHYCRYNNTFESVIKHSIQAHAKEELKIRRKCLCDKTGEQKYQVFNCGLIPNSVKYLSAIEINNENWTVRAVSVEISKKRSNGQNDAHLVNKKVKRTDDAPTDFSKQYDELCKILPKVANILYGKNQLDILLKFFLLIENETFNFENIYIRAAKY